MKISKTFNCEKALESLNRSAKKIQAGIIILMIGSILAGMLFLLFLFDSGNSQQRHLWKIFMVHGGLIFLLFFFYLSQKIPRNKWNLINFILLQRTDNQPFGVTYFIKVCLRAFGSFSVFLFCAFLPAIWLFATDQLNHMAYSHYAGTFLVVTFIVFFGCYGALLLPTLIGDKTKKSRYKYLYWLYFLKGRMTESGITLFMGIPLIVITSLIIVCTTLTFQDNPKIHMVSKIGQNKVEYNRQADIEKASFTKKSHLLFSKEYLSRRNFFEVDRFSLLISSFGIWLSIIIIIIGDMLKNYQRIYSIYEDYTTYILRENVLNSMYMTYILVGYGILNKHSLRNYLKGILNREGVENDPMGYFDVIIDRQYDLRIIPRDLTIIDSDKDVFEETRHDENTGVEFGFVNAGELLLDEEFDRRRINELAAFGIVANGKSLASLKLAGINTAQIVINASSDPSMGIDLQRLIHENNSLNDKPVLITTVENSTSYSFLERTNDLAIFPLHPGITEGNAIGTRLYMLFNKLNQTPDNSFSFTKNSPIIIFIGNGKTTYYSIKQFVVHTTLFKFQDLESFLKNNMLVISTDQNVMSSCKNLDKDGLGEWDCFFGHNNNYSIRLLLKPPEAYSSIEQAWKIVEDNRKRKIIFIITATDFYNELNILQHLKQSISEHNSSDAVIISSIEHDQISRYMSVTESMSDLYGRVIGHIGFPHKPSDLIIKKDMLTGNQISSLMDCLQVSNKDLEFRRKMNSEGKRDSTTPPKSTGELAICANNKPGVLVSTLCSISGLQGLKTTEGVQAIPSFYYSYSFKINDHDQQWADTFIFRGDCFLKKVPNAYLMDHHITGVGLNGTDTFIDEYCESINQKLLNLKIDNSCGYHPSCPVSTNHNILDYRQPLPSTAILAEPEVKASFDIVSPILATVKIWADQDSTPGALAMALADFLLLGADVTPEPAYRNIPIMNIVYESCNSCTKTNKLIMRFYAKGANAKDVEIQAMVDKLMDQSNIIGLKIKLNGPADTYWKTYFDQLTKYMQNAGDADYDTFVLVDEFQMIKQSLRSHVGGRSFFDTL